MTSRSSYGMTTDSLLQKSCSSLELLSRFRRTPNGYSWLKGSAFKGKNLLRGFLRTAFPQLTHNPLHWQKSLQVYMKHSVTHCKVHPAQKEYFPLPFSTSEPKHNLGGKYPFIFSWLANFIVAFNYLFPIDWILPWREVSLSTDFPNSRNME